MPYNLRNVLKQYEAMNHVEAQLEKPEIRVAALTILQEICTSAVQANREARDVGESARHQFVEDEIDVKEYVSTILAETPPYLAMVEIDRIVRGLQGLPDGFSLQQIARKLVQHFNEYPQELYELLGV